MISLPLLLAFTLHAEPPVRFAAFGDCGTGKSAQVEVAKAVKAWKPDFMVLLGDIVYPSGEFEDYTRKYFEPYRDLLASATFFSAVGNHDYGNYRDAGRGERRFQEGYARVLKRPKYYSFDAGAAHLIALDANREGSSIGAAEPLEEGGSQWRWLDADLAASRARWKIVLLHAPLYSSAKHGSNASLQKALGPLFRKHGVQLVLQAHDHAYERTRPIDGTVYVTAGNGGARLYSKRTEKPWSKAFIKEHGFVAIAVAENALVLEMIGADGAVKDQLRLKAGP